MDSGCFFFLVGLLRGQLNNLLLLGLFWMQHSGMCSSFWKGMFKDTPYACTERSVYVIATGAAIQVRDTSFSSHGMQGYKVILPQVSAFSYSFVA